MTLADERGQGQTMIGQSPAIEQLLQQIRQIASLDTTVGSSSQRISALRHNHMKSNGKAGEPGERPTAYKALAVCLGK